MVKAHRFAWQLRYGDVPADKLVCHTCDNPPCANADHLFLGDIIDNNKDSKRKGRNAKGERHSSVTKPESVPRGESHGMVKLTADQVEEIRRLYAEGLYYQRELGEMFGVSQTQVGRIVRGTRWKSHASALT
jgi:predicted DNA-binding protein (UPF0251 family)